MTKTYNPPPNWPSPPSGQWSPPPGWQPDPSWPPPPAGWQLWVDDIPATRPWYKKRRYAVPGGLVAALVVISAVNGAGQDDGTVTTLDSTGAAVSPSVVPTPAATSSRAAAKASAKPAAVAPPSPAAKPKAKVPGIGDTVRDGDLEFTVTKIATKSRVGDDFLNKTAQGKFLLVHVRVTNIGDNAQTLSGERQTMIDSQGREFSADTGAAMYLGDAKTFWEEINPGNSVDGIVVFDVPKKTNPDTLELHDSYWSRGVKISL